MVSGSDEPARVAALREALPSTAAGIQLDVIGAGPLPAESARAMAEADEWDLRTGRAGVDRREDVAVRLDEARGVLAALVGADGDQLVITHGVHDAIELARRLAGSDALAVVEHVNPSTGRSTARQSGLDTPWLLDCGNTAGVVPIRASETGAAFVAVAGERWLLGPEGTGALWIDRDVAGADGATAAQELLDPLPRRSVLGLARSVGWLEMYVGLPWLYERTAHVARFIRSRLASIEGVELDSPVDDPAALAVFSIAGWSADDAARELGARCFAILGPAVDEQRLRISTGAWNTEDELDRFASTVELLAQHTPASLPRRPSLVVLGSNDRT